jgi:chemotaxis protein methyltransferase CheR
MSSIRKRAIARALEILTERVGFGSGSGTPGWVEERVGNALEAHATRHDLTLLAAAERLQEEPAAVEEILAALRVGETRFYRDHAQWQTIEAFLAKEFAPHTELSVLSAGCSTGEEAYTMAMLLTSAGRRFRLLGVDRSAAAIAHARTGVFPADSARNLPPAWIERYCSVWEGVLTVGEQIRESVRFEEQDLVQRCPRGLFHIILFKNVLLYLASPIGEEVTEHLMAELHPKGLLFPAASEVLRLQTAGFTPVRLGWGVTAFRARVATGRSRPR